MARGVYAEFEKQRNNQGILFKNLAETRELVLTQRIEMLKDQLEQCRIRDRRHTDEKT